MKLKNLLTTALMATALLMVSNVGWGQYTGTGIFEQITSLEDLESGTYYVFYGINGSYNGAMTNTVSSGKMGNTGVTISGPGIVDPPASVVWLIEGNDVDGYTIYNEEVEKYCEITSTGTSGFSLNDSPTYNYDDITVDAGNFVIRTSFEENRCIAIYQNDWRTYVNPNTVNLYKLAEASDDPAIIAGPTTLTGFDYYEGFGPSDSQTLSVSAQNLDPAAGNLTVTGSTNFEVSIDNTSFSSSVQIPYSGGDLSSTDIYIRLKAGLNEGAYNDEIVEVTGGSAPKAEVTVSGIVNPEPPMLPYSENFSDFVSYETLPHGWEVSNTVYGDDWGLGTGAGLRGNANVLGFQHTSSTGIFEAKLSIQNNTGATIEELSISYMGKVERVTEGRSPEWTVKLNDLEVPDLFYSTVNEEDQLKSAVIDGLNIANNTVFTITWSSDRGEESGSSKQIGISDVEVSTSSSVSTNANLSTFTLGGLNALELSGVVVDNPETDDGADLFVSDFTDFKGIVATPAHENATRIVKLNGTDVAEGDLADQALVADDVVVVTVTAEDEVTKKHYKVTLTSDASDEAEILTYTLPNQVGDTDFGDGTIGVTLPVGTDVTELVATFTLSDGASAKVGDVAQESGVTENDFSSPVTYVVTAEDQTTTKDWVVTVTVQEASVGLETFDNLDLTGSTYTDGTFIGQDGSTWTYTQCRGDVEITGKAIMIGRNRTPQSNFYSGTIPNGVGVISFDYMQAFSTDVNLNILINDEVVGNVTTDGEEGVVKNSGEITVNVAGDFVMKFENVNNSDGQVVVDNIEWTGYQDTDPPVPTFFPADGAEDIARTVNPTITFDETIYTSDGDLVDDTNVEGLITFVDADDAAVEFSATIEDDVISIVPDESLEFETVYTITIQAVQDEFDNLMDAPASTSFTTRLSTTPVIELISLHGDSLYYAGDEVRVEWESDNISLVAVELYKPIDDTWVVIADDLDAADGEVDVTIPADALFSNSYRLLVRNVDNEGLPTDTSDAFTVRAVADDIATARDYAANDEFRFDGEAIVTATDAFQNRKFIQDETAAILIYDSDGIITSTYEIGDGISGLLGKITVSNNMVRLVPMENPGEPISTGNDVSPTVKTIPGVTTNDQAKFIRFNNVTFINLEEGDEFENGKNYTISDGENEFAVRTDFWNIDYIGEVIPTTPVNLKGIVLQYQEILQIVPRFADDIIELGVDAEILTFDFEEEDVILDVYISPVVDNMATIEVVVADGTNIAELTPTMTISEGATIDPFPGVVTDFTNPVSYSVTSEDGNTVNTYTVYVEFEPTEIFQVPYFEDFESYADTDDFIENSFWKTVDADGDGYNWFLHYDAEEDINVMASRSWISDDGPLTPENWLITPAIEIPSLNDEEEVHLTFHVAASGNNYFEEHYKIVVSTTGNFINDFNDENIVLEETLTEEVSGWSFGLRRVNLSQFQNEIVHIAFVHYDCTDMDRLIINNVGVDVLVPYTVTFNVSDSEGPIEDATVSFDGFNYHTDADGIVIVEGVEAGSYDYTVIKEDYHEQSGTVEVVDDDVTIDITLIPVGIDPEIFANLEVYPNPFSDHITLLNAENVNRVFITNLVGQRVADIYLNGDNSINTSSLVSGVYLVTFEAANGERMVRKMIKQ